MLLPCRGWSSAPGRSAALTIPHKGTPRGLQKERRKTMRGHHGSGRYHGVPAYGMPYNSGTINITNVTNVTHVTSVTQVNHVGHKRCRERNKGSGLGRPPKLWRFCASCGILDNDRLHGMSNGAIMHESAKAAGYAARKLGHNLSEMGSGVCQIVEGVAKGVASIVGAVVKACR